LDALFYMRTRPGIFQEFTEPRNFLDPEVVGMRLLEKDALAADAELELIASVGLDLAKMLDQFDGFAPT
jgi:hypothetical protein